MENKLKEINKYQPDSNDSDDHSMSQSSLFNHKLYQIERTKDETVSGHSRNFL